MLILHLLKCKLLHTQLKVLISRKSTLSVPGLDLYILHITPSQVACWTLRFQTARDDTIA